MKELQNFRGTQMTPKTCLIPPCHTKLSKFTKKDELQNPTDLKWHLKDAYTPPWYKPPQCLLPSAPTNPTATPNPPPSSPFHKEMKMEQSSRFIEANKGSAEYIMAVHFKPRVHLDNQCKRFAQLNKPILPHISTTNKTIRFMFFYSNLASSNIKYGLLSIYV